MKEYLLPVLIFFRFLILSTFSRKQKREIVLFTKLQLASFLCFVSLSLWAQPPPHTFGTSGTLFVPAGITEMTVQAWGGGGAGGGASGATLLSLTGRGGAGGGGGAYATANITVVPGTTLNVTVARQVAGTTTGIGATGETSTIAGFENIIKAVGGSGGGANTTGAVPAGGAGGLASASSGTTTVNGSPGLIGATALLSLGLNSGAGGKGGIPGGGDGGAAVPGTLENQSGNVGVAPGGGGSGAVQSLSNAAQLGGAGAAGQVIVAYTCPSYGILGVSATGVCTTAGTSTITLTGSAASLPIGVYTVNYNLTNPAQSLTITMTITTAGLGTFVLSGLTAVGTRDITITKLTSGACFVDLTSNNFASIITSAVTNGGTVSGAAAVCNGSTSGTLSLTGHTGSVLNWEYSVSPFTAWFPITNVTTNLVSGPLTETTRFRAVVQNGACAVARSGEAAVVVNPLPQGSLTGNGPFCAGGSPQLLFTATTGVGPYTIVYKENGGADRTVTNITSGIAFAAFTSPVNNSVNYTLVSVTDANNCTRNTGFTVSAATITVNAQSSTPIVGTVVQPTCVISTGSLPLSGLITGSWTLIQTGTVNNMYYGTGTSFTVPDLVPGNYTFTIQDITGCPSLATSNVTIIAPVTNTWDGDSWSEGSLPTNDNDILVFSADYEINQDLNGCSCIINSGVNVVVNSDHTLTIANSVNNNGGTLTFENNASLLQTNEAVNTGNIIYKRYTAPVRRYDFTFWSSPIKESTSFTLHDLSPDTLGDKYYKYDPVIGWIVIYRGDEAMEAGRGYIIRAPQNYDIIEPSVFNARFIGIPNNGTIPIPLAAAEKSYLLGNPYPSAIYADRFIADNAANLYGTLYFWTHNSPPSDDVDGDAKYNYTLDDYAIYNLTGSTTVGDMEGDGADTPGYQEPPYGYIAAGQSFFVTSKTALNAVFTNSMRVPGNNSQFFKNNAVRKGNDTGHRVWLNLTNTQGAFKQLLIGYVEGATNSWDNNYDGLTMDGNKYLDFYSINEMMKLVIQGRSLPFLETDVVPLGYRSIIVGEFTISIDHANGDLSTHDIYLEDKLAKSVHNLKTSNYNFTTAVGTFDDRFVLHYVNKSLGTEDIEGTEQTVVISVKDKIIKVNSAKENIKEVSVFDVSGKLLYNKTKVNATELQIANLQSTNQILLVKTTLENGYSTLKKVVF
ncbi:T9SS sorting signal type C domain-containing protein [Flavobacterium sp. LAR06]|uniref:T9SS sorting signal type C domain-containing protein n=1 Tax=Flavobacterium sp. LAR06 TaxID=3064897 RepID=UPI0035C03A8B